MVTPSRDLIAFWACSLSGMVIKAKPFARPVFRSMITFTLSTLPYSPNTSRNVSSLISYGRLPTYISIFYFLITTPSESGQSGTMALIPGTVSEHSFFRPNCAAAAEYESRGRTSKRFSFKVGSGKEPINTTTGVAWVEILLQVESIRAILSALMYRPFQGQGHRNSTVSRGFFSAQQALRVGPNGNDCKPFFAEFLPLSPCRPPTVDKEVLARNIAASVAGQEEESSLELVG